MRQSFFSRSTRASALPAHAAVIACALAAACSAPDPSPDQLKRVLVQNPDVLVAAVRAHPDSFLAILGEAARVAQARSQATSASADSLRIEAELAHPHSVSTAGRAGFGDPTAPVTIVEYTDFECPFCREERDVLVQLLTEYPRRVRLVVKHMPLPNHPHAYPAALMFEAVARQSPAKAYRLYDVLYSNQSEFASRGESYLREAIGKLGVDVPRALSDAQSDTVKTIVAADKQEGERLGFSGTPGFLVNGVLLQGTYPRSSFERIINRQLSQLPMTGR